MHATHQFFLTKRSLYLLVLNGRDDRMEKEADYWFRLIRVFGGPEAPVLVILNRQIELPFDVNQREWQERYSNIKAFIKTDCADPRSIQALQHAIEAAFARLKSVKDSFPAQWFQIKDELAGMQQDFVTFADYRAMCRRLNEADEEKQTMLAGYLHDLGIALNYRNDPRLRYAYVLKPEWVTTGIYTLLHAFREAKGLFTPSEARAVLKEKNYSPEATDFILALMEQFELSFPFGDSGKRILIPQLLDDQQPAAASDFRPADCLNFGYEYSVAPKGLLPRFVTRTHYWSKPALRWKSGVILDRDGARALVRVDTTTEQVRIHVTGPVEAGLGLLAIIRGNFEAIHLDLHIEPINLVYPPGQPDAKQSVRELRALQKRGAVTRQLVLPDDSIVEPRIDTLVEPAKDLPPRLKVFVSYAHKDLNYIPHLETILKRLERLGLISVWRDSHITAGGQWEEVLLNHLDDADVVLCQLTNHYLASDYCLAEFARAVELADRDETLLIPYQLLHCPPGDPPHVGRFQMLPKPLKPIQKWKEGKHAYWTAISLGLEAALRPRQAQLAQRDPHLRAGHARSF